MDQHHRHGVGTATLDAEDGVATVQLHRMLTIEFEARLVLDEPAVLRSEVLRIVAMDPPFRIG
jgi:hypothetical protein